MRFFERDGGAYITAGIIVTEFDGVRNASFHRMMVIGKNKVVARLVPPRHTYMLHKKAKEQGISAIIATDMSVIQYARTVGMEVHMSTQTNVTNIEAVRFYSQFADVMVTARELSLRQVAAITKTIQEQQIKGPSGRLVEIEVFVHGALCMAISGKCYLSLDNLDSSANRGACLQQCRRPYKVIDDSGIELEIDNEYIMSPKDLKTVDILDKVLKAGVRVLKIEGRGRAPDYVKTVTSVYRKAVDAYFNNDFKRKQP